MQKGSNMATGDLNSTELASCKHKSRLYFEIVTVTEPFAYFVRKLIEAIERYSFLPRSVPHRYSSSWKLI